MIGGAPAGSSPRHSYQAVSRGTSTMRSYMGRVLDFQGATRTSRSITSSAPRNQPGRWSTHAVSSSSTRRMPANAASNVGSSPPKSDACHATVTPAMYPNTCSFSSEECARRYGAAMALRTSPLDAVHRAFGAKLVEFGGWDMPVSYPSGTIAEHLACRRDAAIFDVSHLGTVRVTGPGAFDALQSTLTSDLSKIEPGRTQYHHLLDDADGSVLDDIIVVWVDEERFDVMPNASNTARVIDAIPGVDVTDERAILAVQGPQARTRLRGLAPEAAAVPRRAVARVDVAGISCVVSGTGYTGEDGVELAVPADAAAKVWDAVVDTGVVPAGLGARDTLRLEAGLPLHGHELGPGITPLQAGLSWVVAWKKATFRGKAALEAERARGVSRLLRGIIVEGRRPPREGCAVLAGGRAVGEVTSGNFSPVLERGIALAFLPPQMQPGAPVDVDVRGSKISGWVTTPPFVGGKDD